MIKLRREESINSRNLLYPIFSYSLFSISLQRYFRAAGNRLCQHCWGHRRHQQNRSRFHRGFIIKFFFQRVYTHSSWNGLVREMHSCQCVVSENSIDMTLMHNNKRLVPGNLGNDIGSSKHYCAGQLTVNLNKVVDRQQS